MSKYAIITFLLVFYAFDLMGQYKADNWYLSPKISFADYGDRNDWSGYSIKKIPPISVAVEKGINDYLSAGVLTGFYRDKYINDTLQTNVHRYMNFAVGTLATVHFAGWIEKLSDYSLFLGDWDFYVSGGVLLKWNNRKESDVWNDALMQFEQNKSSDFDIVIRPLVGLRYFVTDDFSMLIEVGNANLGVVTTGVTWRIR